MLFLFFLIFKLKNYFISKMSYFKNKLRLNNIINTQSYDFPQNFEFTKIFGIENEKENSLTESLNDEYFFMRIYFNNIKVNNNIYKPNLNEINKNDKNTEPDSNQQFINKRRGRKKKRDNNIAEHNKSSEDNLIRKIKRYLLDYILLLLNCSIKFKSGKFRHLNKKMKERLKKDENLELLNKTIADIFSNTKMNKISEKKGKSNKDLIEKIFKENIETETIKILEKTFQEILNEIRDKYLDDFLAKIKEKETKIENKNKMENNNKKDFDIESYINKAKNLLFRFEEWFRDKKGRNRIKEDIKSFFN